MSNPFIMETDIVVGPITLTFQVPTATDKAAWDAIAAADAEDTQKQVSDLLWSLLKSTKIDGAPAPVGWEDQLRESGLLNGPNGIGVGVKLFRFRTVPVVVSGLEGSDRP